MKKSAILLAAVGLFAISSPAISQPASSGRMPPRCFFSNQFQNWTAPDKNTIYVRVGLHHYYRLDLAAPCQRLTWPGAFLITKLHGSNSICTALDWDLHVATSWRDIPEACIVKKMTALSPDEAEAIPKSSRP